MDIEPQRQTNVNSAGVLYPGQRMDFILRSPPEVDAKQPSSMTVGLDPEYVLEYLTWHKLTKTGASNILTRH